LVPIEAMAMWTPVIAYGKGWALETVLDRKTGIFFYEQSVESFNRAIEEFETLGFDYEGIKKYAQKFDKEVFKKEILEFIEDKLKK
jgi:glycosyltransferase involved in cell wall biosynthesis